VQQTAYQLIPPAERPQRHLDIARALTRLVEQGANNAEQHAFAIADHSNRSMALLSEPAERDRALQANLQAARRAREINAFAAAFGYFQQALGLLDADCWNQHYPLTLALYSEATGAAYFSADFVTAKQLAGQLRQHARSVAEGLEGYRIPMLIAFSESRLDESQRICQQALARLGIEGVQYDSLEVLKPVATQLAQRLDKFMEKPPETLPLIESPQYDSALCLMHILILTVSWSNLVLTQGAICRAVALILEHGVQQQTPHILLAFAAIRSLVLDDAGGGRAHGGVRSGAAAAALRRAGRRTDGPLYR
jgi:predicted ATPase